MNAPVLWTDIKISLKSSSNRRIQALLSRTDLFLDRAGDLLLDVEWHMFGNAKSVPLFYDLFRRKSSFGRWRTLSVDLNEDIKHPLGELRDIDRFSNLEALNLMRPPPPAYLEHISATVTSKLHGLELGPKFNYLPKVAMDYSRIFEQIYHIVIWRRVDLTAVPLPPNVHMLNGDIMPSWPIPHVQHLFMNLIDLGMLSSLRLENLVSLQFQQVEGFMPDMSITLPNLLWLVIRGEGFTALAALKAPSLHTLRIKCPQLPNQTIDGPFVTALKKGFEARDLLILSLGVNLDGPATLEVIRIFPNVSRVHLYYCDAEHAQTILSQIFPHPRDLTTCPFLNDLRVFLDVPPHDNAQWEGCVRNIATNIGDPLWNVNSDWPGGAFDAPTNPGTQKTRSIYPWVRGVSV